MLVVEAFRAQYYIHALEKEIEALERDLNNYSFLLDRKALLDSYASDVAESIDQMLLPTIVYEIHRCKEEKKLKGLTARSRYKSFFVQNNIYTSYARNVITRYPFLFECIDRFIQESFANLKKCLSDFNTDLHEGWLPKVMLKGVAILASSDRHCSQQSLLLTFSDERKIIYKPVTLFPDELLQEFIQQLDLPYPYDLQTMDILPKDTYGWIKFLQPKECETPTDLHNFYKRTGILLSIADCLNYSDGHCENLFACGAYPILLDGETLFQNYAAAFVEQKNIISTLLIQKLDSDLKIHSALQVQSITKYETFHTHAAFDGTDAIQIQYAGISRDRHHHMPCYNENHQRACDYKEHVIDGYRFGFDRISHSMEKILHNTSWWDKVAAVRVRTVLRGTSAYFFLLRRIQQPDFMACKEKAYHFLKEQLGDTPYTEYEAQDLLSMNIPYYYHFPGQRHLFDGANNPYFNTFAYTAIDQIKEQISKRTIEQKERDCEIIHRYLIPTTQIANPDTLNLLPIHQVHASA